MATKLEARERPELLSEVEWKRINKMSTERIRVKLVKEGFLKMCWLQLRIDGSW